jgi:hypothetical protein
MTRIGRFVAGVGATVLGLVVTAAYFVAVIAIDPEAGTVWAILLGLAGFAVFGVVTPALSTWAVDGPFVRRRQRSH